MDYKLLRHIFFLFHCLLCCVSLSAASGKITFKIIKYDSPQDYRSYGTRCDLRFGNENPFCHLSVKVCIGRMRTTCDLLEAERSIPKDEKIFDWSSSPERAPTFVVAQKKLPFYVFMKVRLRVYDRQSRKYNAVIYRHSFSPELNGKLQYNLYPADSQHDKELEIQVNTKCEEHYFGPRCDKFCQPRFPNEDCTPVGQRICKKGWYGQHCAFQTCLSSNKCQNGGECQQNSEGTKCLCLSGFKGVHCEIISPCASSPCQNGGECVWIGDSNRFQCKCTANFNGSLCEHFIPCLSQPCFNGGQCLQNRQKDRKGIPWMCRCGAGFIPPRCSMPDRCQSRPCQHGGACKTVLQGRSPKFVCHCKPLFKGSMCQYRNISCQTVTCLNGGVCKILSSNSSVSASAVCRCHTGFKGNRCEIAVLPSKNEASKTPVEVTSFSVSRRSNERNDKADSAELNSNLTITAGRQSLNLAVIIVLIVSGVCFLFLIIGVMVMFRRRHRKASHLRNKFSNPSSIRGNSSEDTRSVTLLKRGDSDEDERTNQPNDSAPCTGDETQFAIL